MAESIWWIVTVVNDKRVANKLARGAIAERKAACAQVEGPIQSFYRWEGKQECSEEWKISYKAAAAKVDPLVAWIASRHPYEVPEILAGTVSKTLPAYAEWVNEG